MLKLIVPALIGLVLFVSPNPSANTNTVEKLSGEWLVISIQAELSPDQVTYHNSIPRKLYDQGRIGQKVLLVLPESDIASSDDIAWYWKWKSFLVSPESSCRYMLKNAQITPPIGESLEDKVRSELSRLSSRDANELKSRLGEF